MNRKITSIIFICLSWTVLIAQNKVGTTAANFLTIPVGARATSMGGAFVALANDATTAYWNAGGISRLSSNEFVATHADWLVGTNYNWVGAVIKFDPDNAIALSFSQLDYGQDEITTADQPNGTGENWDAMDIAVGLSYSRNLTDRFSIGGTVKYIQQRIWKESASSFALDIGLLFITQFDGLRLGMNIANFGTEMQLDGKDLLQAVDIDPSHAGNNANIVSTLGTDSWTLPLVFSVGLAYDIIKNDDWVWTVASDAVYPNNQTSYINVGSEFGWNNMVFIRAGYNSLFKQNAQEGLTAGIGLQYDSGPVKLRVEYSYMDYGIFNEISRYSVTIGF